MPPLLALVESADLGCVARIKGIPIFAYGDNEAEAISALTDGIQQILQDGKEFGDQRTAIQKIMKSTGRPLVRSKTLTR